MKAANQAETSCRQRQPERSPERVSGHKDDVRALHDYRSTLAKGIQCRAPHVGQPPVGSTACSCTPTPSAGQTPHRQPPHENPSHHPLRTSKQQNNTVFSQTTNYTNTSDKGPLPHTRATRNRSSSRRTQREHWDVVGTCLGNKPERLFLRVHGIIGPHFFKNSSPGTKKNAAGFGPHLWDPHTPHKLGDQPSTPAQAQAQAPAPAPAPALPTDVVHTCSSSRAGEHRRGPGGCCCCLVGILRGGV